jgi:hypothetical protein
VLTFTDTYPTNHKAVLAACRRRGWKLIDAQIAVRDKKGSTVMDFLATDGEGRTIVLELKTRMCRKDTHDTEYRKVDPKKKRTHTGYRNSMYWRHQKQVIETRRMYAAMTKKTKVYSAVIVSLRDGVAVYVTPKV